MRFFDYLIETHSSDDEDDQPQSIQERIRALQIQLAAISASTKKYHDKETRLFAEFSTNPMWFKGWSVPNEKDPSIFKVPDWGYVEKNPETLILLSKLLVAKDKHNKWAKKGKVIADELNALKRVHTQEKHTERAKNRSNLTPMRELGIPQKVGYSLHTAAFLKNPYFESEDHYAGHPDGFVFDRELRQHFEMLDLMLKHANVPGFSLLYGCTYPTPRRASKQSFLAYAGDGRFCWAHNVDNQLNAYYYNGRQIRDIDPDDPNCIHRIKTLFPEYQ